MAKNEEKTIVLFGTYKGDQLKTWPNYYNYPISNSDKITKEDAMRIEELWLFKGTTAQKTFSAKFVGIKTRKELINDYAYPATGKAHSDKYLLFEIIPIEYPSIDDKKVILRTKDFASSKKLQTQLKAYLESDAREAFGITSKLPEVINTIPKANLCVCENAFQLSFWDLSKFADLKPEVPFPSPSTPKFKFIDLFAGIGGIRLGFQSVGGECVFSSEFDEDACVTYEANFGEHPAGDITKISAKDIPDFDILLGGFPCQAFSIIGKQEGFSNETCGTLFFEIERILKEKRPTAFMLENVRNLTAHDGGKTFRTIKNHLEALGYHVYTKVLNALDYGVPQKRERIFIVGFLDDVAFEFPPPLPVEKRPILTDILEENVDKKYYVRDVIRQSRLERIKDKDYPRPYISHENKSGSITPHPYSSALRAGASANYILINDERRPTEREMLRFQGFPDAYKIVLPYGKVKKQCGNSVAVPVVKAIAEEMVKVLKTFNEKEDQ